MFKAMPKAVAWITGHSKVRDQACGFPAMPSKRPKTEQELSKKLQSE